MITPWSLGARIRRKAWAWFLAYLFIGGSITLLAFMAWQDFPNVVRAIQGVVR
jgi:hypothetical protein